MSEKTVGDAVETQLAALLRNLETQSRSAALFLEKSSQQVDRLSELLLRLQGEFEGGAEERSEASRKRTEARPSTARRIDEPVKASRSFVHNTEERRANLTPPPAISSAKKGCAPPDNKIQPVARTVDTVRNVKVSCVVRDPKKETAMRDSKVMTISRPSVHERLAKTPKEKAKAKPETAPPKPKGKDTGKPRVSATLPKAIKALSEETISAPVPEVTAAEEEPSLNASLREEGGLPTKEATNTAQNVETQELNPPSTKESPAPTSETLAALQQEQYQAPSEVTNLPEREGQPEGVLLRNQPAQNSESAALPREPPVDERQQIGMSTADQPTAASLSEQKLALPGVVAGEAEPLFDISVSAVLPPEPTNLPGTQLLSSALLGESAKGMSEELPPQKTQLSSLLPAAAPSEKGQQLQSDSYPTGPEQPS